MGMGEWRGRGNGRTGKEGKNVQHITQHIHLRPDKRLLREEIMDHPLNSTLLYRRIFLVAVLPVIGSGGGIGGGRGVDAVRVGDDGFRVLDEEVEARVEEGEVEREAAFSSNSIHIHSDSVLREKEREDGKRRTDSPTNINDRRVSQRVPRIV